MYLCSSSNLVHAIYSDTHLHINPNPQSQYSIVASAALILCGGGIAEQSRGDDIGVWGVDANSLNLFTFHQAAQLGYGIPSDLPSDFLGKENFLENVYFLNQSVKIA